MILCDEEDNVFVMCQVDEGAIFITGRETGLSFVKYVKLKLCSCGCNCVIHGEVIVLIVW